MTGIWLPATRRHPIGKLDHGPRARTRGIVLHINEGTFEGTIQWFEGGANGVGAHVQIGDSEAWQLLGLERKAWHAVQANTDLIGFEHAGFVKRTRKQWVSEHHRELALSANRAAWCLHEFDLGHPRRGVNIFRHSDGGAAWGGHNCPGPNFPMDVWLELCHDAYYGHWGRGVSHAA